MFTEERGVSAVITPGRAVMCAPEEERGVSAVIAPGRAVMSRVVLGIAQQLVGAGRCSS